MKKIFVSLIIGGIVGGFFGFAGGLFIYPYWFPPPPAKERVADRASKTVVAAGLFIQANPSDPIHYGSGAVEILKGADGARLVHLMPDFKVGPGPRFHVYLADRAAIKSNDDFKAAKVTDLGLLRAFEGSQIYNIRETWYNAGEKRRRLVQGIRRADLTRDLEEGQLNWHDPHPL